MGSKFLNKDAILNHKPTLKEVAMPQWGGSVNIRAMSVSEQAQLAELGVKHEKDSTSERIKNITLQVVKWVVCDEDGKPLFDDSDVEKLMQTDASAILDLQRAIVDYSGLTAEARKELEKNLQSQAEGQSSSSLAS
jgi:hypothetical protein